jgi:AraC family transcriptional regulator
MNAAIAFIEARLHGELSLEDVAGVARCSKYHFHRVFYAAFQVTCAEYIRRRRLTLAAVALMNSDQSITEIALNFGYDSPNAFTRAFRNVHGVNPSKARAESVRLAAYQRVSFPLQQHDGMAMDYQIVEKPEFQILGKSKGFSFDDFVKHGPKFWKEYVASEDYRKLYHLNQGRSGLVIQAPMLSAYFPKDESTRNEFVDVLGIEATADMASKDFEQHTVPAACYAEFCCTYKTSMKTNRAIYGDWFAATGYECDGNKPDVVAYFPIPFRPMGEMLVRWWVPVVRKIT